MARAIRYSEHGGPEVLRIEEIPDPVAGPGQVTVRVEAAGVNPVDAKMRRRGTAGPLTAPRGTGQDGAGYITSVGEGVDGFRVGDAVVFTSAGGSYATDIAIDAGKVSFRPPGVSAAQGAGVPIPCGTAYQALRSLGLRADDTLLIHGGSGSVGQAAIQFAVMWGARVIATTSPARAERVAGLGAEPLPYGPGLVDAVREAAPDGVTVILDCAGTDEALAQSLELLADRSRIATIVAGSQAPDLGIRAFSAGSPTPLTERQKALRAEAIPVTLALMAAGRFSIELGERYALDQAAEAQRASEAGAPGKLVVVP
ncbi:NADP-dependent oxidoreductase [Microbacterium sp. Marseille-Q6965]|uniref:quinone oxidoreductase family protein n=1 Tax=Microbacterium sp. Marseille-Q6965 TaxID=2965072 RepID=UPI0021B7ADC0|nr:NADP-dependent oxidoreductase [Microbacterium sp. Marseille-Q6965]